MVTITEVNAAVGERRVAQLEANIMGRLPEAYRSFLLEHNGGEPDLDHYQISGMANNPFGEIRMFLGLDATENYDDLEWNLRLLRDRLPSQFLPVGYSSGGDMICVSLNAHDYGTIYFWDSQATSEPSNDARSGYSNLYYVAEDFGHFLKELNTFESFTA